MTYDEAGDRLLLLDAATNRLIEIRGGARALRLGPVELESPRLGPARIEGLALDRGRERVRARPPRAPHRRVPPACRRKRRRRGLEHDSIPLAEGIRGDLRGLAFDPRTRHFFILSPGLGTLYEVNETGRGVGAIDVSALDLREPGGMVLAPSGDPTDDPAARSLYVAVAGGSRKRRAAMSPRSR